MNKKRSNLINSTLMHSKENAEKSLRGFYMKNIYEDLQKVRTRKNYDSEHQDNNKTPIISKVSAKSNRKIKPKSDCAVQCNPENYQDYYSVKNKNENSENRTSLSRYLVRNEGTARKESPPVKTSEQINYEIILKEKDDHIAMLRKMLSKAIKLLGNIHSENSSRDIQNFLDSIANSTMRSFENNNTLEPPVLQEIYNTNNLEKSKAYQTEQTHKQTKSIKLNKSFIQNSKTPSNPNKGSIKKNLKTVESALKNFLGGFNEIKSELSMIGETIAQFEP